MNRHVVKITPSPMNALRWLLALECGHWVWVTRKQRPTRKTARCNRCSVIYSGTEPADVKSRRRSMNTGKEPVDLSTGRCLEP